MWWRLLLLFILPLLHGTQWCHWFSASTSFVSSSSAFFLTGFWTLAAFFLYTATGLTGCWTLAVLAAVFLYTAAGETGCWTLAVFFIFISVFLSSSSSGRTPFVLTLFAYLKLSCKRFASAFCDAVEYFLGWPLTGGTQSWMVFRCLRIPDVVAHLFPHVGHCSINELL